MFVYLFDCEQLNNSQLSYNKYINIYSIVGKTSAEIKSVNLYINRIFRILAERYSRQEEAELFAQQQQTP